MKATGCYAPRGLRLDVEGGVYHVMARGWSGAL
jgi:hypothetical protein